MFFLKYKCDSSSLSVSWKKPWITLILSIKLISYHPLSQLILKGQKMWPVIFCLFQGCAAAAVFRLHRFANCGSGRAADIPRGVARVHFTEQVRSLSVLIWGFYLRKNIPSNRIPAKEIEKFDLSVNRLLLSKEIQWILVISKMRPIGEWFFKNQPREVVE